MRGAGGRSSTRAVLPSAGSFRQFLPFAPPFQGVPEPGIDQPLSASRAGVDRRIDPSISSGLRVGVGEKSYANLLMSRLVDSLKPLARTTALVHTRVGPPAA